MRKLACLVGAIGLLLAPLTAPAGVEDAAVVRESFLVPAADPGIALYVRNKHLAGKDAFPPERIVLLVHGATYPSETVYDLDLPGGSWMDHLARRGYDAYLVDVRGYGGSTRPAAMDVPADRNPPFATTAEAVKDVRAAIDFILQRRRAAKLSLVGWSWGTTIMGGYAADHGDRVHKLVLYAPVWLFKSSHAAPPSLAGGGAYRSVQRDVVRQRGLRGIPPERAEEVSPTPWFERWWKATLATDPVGAKQSPPVLRAPNGVLKDLFQDHWSAGKPTYDPGRIRAPTLVVVGEWDQDTGLAAAQEVFGKLVAAAYKRHVVLGEGTHTIALERNRMHLIREVQAFLDEEPPALATSAWRRTAESVVQEQLDAYNAQDLDGFVATFSDDVVVTSGPSKQVLLKGKAALRERYAKMFQTYPRCHCRIAERRTEGDRVVLDHEIITGRGPDRPDPWDVGFVRYEVEGGVIKTFHIP